MEKFYLLKITLPKIKFSFNLFSKIIFSYHQPEDMYFLATKWRLIFLWTRVVYDFSLSMSKNCIQLLAKKILEKMGGTDRSLPFSALLFVRTIGITIYFSGHGSLVITIFTYSKKKIFLSKLLI